MNVEKSAGFSCTSRSSSTLTMPRPSDDWRMRSFRSNSGSPKNTPAIVGVLEDHRQYGGLRLVEAQYFRQEERPERRHGRAELRAERAGEAQELDGKGRGLPRVSSFLGALRDARRGLARRGNSGHVTLDVRHEHRNSRRRKLLGHQLQGFRLARTRGTRNESVPGEHRERNARHGLRMALAIVHDGSERDGWGVTGKRGLRHRKDLIVH